MPSDLAAPCPKPDLRLALRPDASAFGSQEANGLDLVRCRGRISTCQTRLLGNRERGDAVCSCATSMGLSWLLEPLVVADLGVDVFGMGVEIQIANEFLRVCFTHEAVRETWNVRIDRGSGGMDQVFDQIDRVLVADSKSNRGRAQACLS